MLAFLIASKRQEFVGKALKKQSVAIVNSVDEDLSGGIGMDYNDIQTTEVKADDEIIDCINNNAEENGDNMDDMCYLN